MSRMEDGFSPLMNEANQDWLSTGPDGELAIDIFREDAMLVIRSTVAGVRPEEIDIAIDGDLLTIRGQRRLDKTINEDDWFMRECYWGSFSRSVVLPLDVYPEATQASLKNGILEIRLPVRGGTQRITISTVE